MTMAWSCMHCQSTTHYGIDHWLHEKPKPAPSGVSCACAPSVHSYDEPQDCPSTNAPEVSAMRKILTNPQIDATDCVRCHGAGMRGPDEPCPVCEGTGGEPRYAPEVPARFTCIKHSPDATCVHCRPKEVPSKHDTDDGPCACGAWHKKEVPAPDAQLEALTRRFLNLLIDSKTNGGPMLHEAKVRVAKELCAELARKLDTEEPTADDGMPAGTWLIRMNAHELRDTMPNYPGAVRYVRAREGGR